MIGLLDTPVTAVLVLYIKLLLAIAKLILPGCDRFLLSYKLIHTRSYLMVVINDEAHSFLNYM